MLHQPVSSQSDAAVRFLRALHLPLLEAEQIELRWKRPGTGGPMRREFFANIDEAAQKALILGYDHDVYFGVAPRRGNDGTRAGVTRLRTLYADLDLKAGHSRERRLEQIESLPYTPSIRICSGGGYHTYWLLSEAADGPTELERAEGVMRRLGAGLGGDPIWDRSRILRVPGTLNHKQDEPRPVTLEHFDPERRYSLDQLEQMAEAFPQKERADGYVAAPHIRKPTLEGLGLAPDLSRLPSGVQDLIRNGNKGRYPSRSEADWAVCTAMFKAGYGVDEIWVVMTTPENDISEKFFHKGAGGEAYLELTLSKAREYSKHRKPRPNRKPGRVYASRQRKVSID